MAKSRLQEEMEAAGLQPEGVTDGGSDAHINNTVAPEPSPADLTAPVTPPPPVQPAGAPSLAADLGKTASDEVTALNAKKAALEAPPTTKQRIFQSLAAALPTIAGAAIGGRFGAAGAAQGTAEELSTQREQKLAQDKMLNEQINQARGRQEKAADLAAQLEQQRLATQERLAATQAIVGGRENVAGQNNAAKTNIADAATKARQAAVDASMLAKGFKRNDQGEYEETPEKQAKDKAENAYKDALTDHQKAMAEYERTRNDPNSPAAQQAAARLAVTQGNLAMRQKEFEVHVMGTVGGQVPAGAQLTPEGAPVGTLFQQNVRPTAQQVGKADLAKSASEQMDDMRRIITAHPEVFGPVAGRTTQFENWLGSEDPDAKRFATAQTVAADHMVGTFGARGGAMVQEMKNALAQFKDNPQAGLAALDQVQKAAKTFEKSGTRNTSPGGASLNTDLNVRVQTKDGKTGTIPRSKLQQFLKDNQGSRELK